MRIEVSGVIDRPPDVVFQFIGFEHIANHPRWDSPSGSTDWRPRISTGPSWTASAGSRS